MRRRATLRSVSSRSDPRGWRHSSATIAATSGDGPAEETPARSLSSRFHVDRWGMPMIWRRPLWTPVSLKLGDSFALGDDHQESPDFSTIAKLRVSVTSGAPAEAVECAGGRVLFIGHRLGRASNLGARPPDQLFHVTLPEPLGSVGVSILE